MLPSCRTKNGGLKPYMQIDRFLEQFVEGYLFHDLRMMREIRASVPGGYGESSYPMLLSIMAGMELLGCLLSRRPFVTADEDPKGASEQSNKHFSNYWHRYLSASSPRYKHYCDIFRVVVRNGLAHMFVAKPGVVVNKGPLGDWRHLATDTQHQTLFIDCLQLHSDFEKSYFDKVRPIVFEGKPDGRASKESMQDRLNELIGAYSRESYTAFENFRLKIIEETNPAKIASSAGTTAVTTATTGLPPVGGTISVFPPDDERK